jgi:hypothetical protein
MSQIPDAVSLPAANELQFDKVETVTVASSEAAPGPACAACRQPISDAYFAAGDKLICPRCRDNYLAGVTGGPASARFAKATLFGIGGGLLGALIWYAVSEITHYRIGLIAVVVGFLVGRAVQRGSGRRGGREYQVLAVLLTYCSIAAAYVPELVKLVYSRHAHINAHLLGRLAVVIFKMPLLGSTENPIGLLIVGFALWEAWKMNRRRTINLAGPYSMAAGRVPIAQAGSPR